MYDEITYRITVLCNCGHEHTLAGWYDCPLALVPRPLRPWWQVIADGERTPSGGKDAG